jgi:hypothetical protein
MENTDKALPLTELREKMREQTKTDVEKLAADIINFILEKDPSVNTASRAINMVEFAIVGLIGSRVPLSSIVGEKANVENILFCISE